MKLFIISLLSVIISSAVTYYYISNINGVTTLLSIDINRINHETYIGLIKEGKIERLITALEQNIYCDSKNYLKLSADLYGENSIETQRYNENVKKYRKSGKHCDLKSR